MSEPGHNTLTSSQPVFVLFVYTIIVLIKIGDCFGNEGPCFGTGTKKAKLT
jgi:hypothetical protein